MSFQLNEDQWSQCGNLIAKLEGYTATDAVRSDFEEGISRIFSGSLIAHKFEKALFEAAQAAEVFHVALQNLAVSEKERANIADILSSSFINLSVSGNDKLAKTIERYEEGCRENLHSSASGNASNRRGRPVDKEIVSLCLLLLRIAKYDRWMINDSLGRSSSPFIDLAAFLADCAKLGGLTHVRDRRAVCRAMSQARQRYEAEERAAERSFAALDAIAQS